MRLILFRHGIAVDHVDPSCPTDAERFLTDKGRARTRKSARGLRELGVKPEAILSSDYLRAVQTAKIVAQVLGYDPEQIQRTPHLRPMSEAASAFAELRGMTSGDLICVGHAPNLDSLFGVALGIRGESPIMLGKAGAACIDLTHGPGAGILEWAMPPSALRMLGRKA